ncbi:PucC family protein [Leptolyngbya sp. 15MV]|nr:PucC family protein [Leptolyngbya sp. 15MV]
MRRGLGWFAIVRLGAVQAAIGAIVMLATSLLNRLMVVEYAMAAALPAGLVAWHYAVQLTRPAWGQASDRGKARTPWILVGMSLLGLGALMAVNATVLLDAHALVGMLLAILAFTIAARDHGRHHRGRDARTPHPAPLPPPLQDPGGDQAPPDHADPGGEGGTRHEGRRAHHLHLARRPLFRADAELAPRRRRLPQDHLRLRPQAAARGDRRAEPAGGHVAHRADRRRAAAEARDQEGLRIPAAAVGQHPRTHLRLLRARADL